MKKDIISMSNISKKERSSLRMAKNKSSFFIVAVFCLFLMISMISAYEFDNIKSFDKDIGLYGKYEITNAFGLGEKLIDLELTDNTFSCGEECYSINTITLHKKGSLVDDIRFYRMFEDSSDRLSNIRDYEFYIKTSEEEYSVDDYKTICTKTGTYENGTDIQDCKYTKTGSHLEKKPLWEKYNLGDEKEIGTYEVKLVGHKKPSWSYDWQIKSQGIWTTEWATWGNISLGDDAEIILNSPINDYTALVNEVQFNCSTEVTGGSTIFNVSLYTNESGIWSIANTTNYYVDSGAGKVSGGKIYYKADETTGTTANDALGNFDGTIVNDITLGVQGVVNYSYDLQGSNDYVTTSNIDADNLWTVMAWINTDSLSSTQAIWFDDEDAGLFIESDGKVTCGVDDGNAPRRFSTASNVIVVGQWFHVACVWTKDGNSVIYINGTSNATGGGNYNAYDRSGTSNFGGWYTPSSNNFNGKMDEMALWESNLSSSDVQLIFNTTVQHPTNITTIWNRTISDTILWSVEACDSDGDCGYASENRTVDLDTISPTISIVSPETSIEAHSIGDSLYLNATVTDTNLDKCWYEYNSINTTYACSSGVQQNETFTSVEGQQTIIVWANDTVGNTNYESISWTYDFLETGVSFNGNVSETSNQSFELNVTTDLAVLSISAILTYNNTNYTSTVSCVEGNCTIDNTIDISLVTSGDYELHNFFWTMIIYNGTSSSSIQTSTRQQNVTRLYLELCNSTYPQKVLNFSAYDEEPLVQLSNFSFDGTFEFWTGSGTIKRNNSFSQINKTTSLCFKPTTITMAIDGTINYDEHTNFTNYTNRFYYFDNYIINNISEEISLYLLKSTSSTSFILKVQDESLLPVSNAIINIYRYYPGTGEFKIVQTSKTDDNGKSIGFFVTETVDYKFVIKKNGETLLTTGQQKVIPETSPYTLTFNIGTPLEEPWTSQNEIEDLNSTLDFDKSTNIVTYEYIDSSGNFTKARLLVIKESLTNSSKDIIKCNETSELTSATLTCNVGSTNGFYIASAFNYRGSKKLDLQITFQVETLSGVVGTLGLFFGWFLILIASFMFKFNEIAGIWGITITIFLVNLMGLINFGGVFVTAVIAIAVIITWIMER